MCRAYIKVVCRVYDTLCFYNVNICLSLMKYKGLCISHKNDEDIKKHIMWTTTHNNKVF